MKPKGAIKAEAFDVMQYFYRTAHDPLVRFLARLEGRIDEAALKRAVTLSAGAVPQIFCRFRDDVRRPYWEAAGCTGNDAVQVLSADGEPEDFEEQLLARMTVNPRQGPQALFTVVRRGGSDSLCAVMNHMVCDGGGFKDYLYLLCDLYGKCRVDPAYSKASEPSPRGMGALFAGFSLREKLRILAAQDEFGKQKNGLDCHMRGDSASPIIVRRSIAAERFEAGRMRAKALGATANDLLLAAYARALMRLTGEKRIVLPCPVDLRKFIRPGVPRITNLTSNLFCDVTINEGEAFDATLGNVARAMAAQKDGVACLKGPMLYGMVFPLVSFQWLMKNFGRLFTIPVTSYTNLGILDEKRLIFPGTTVAEAYLTGAIKRVPYFQVTASTFKGVCTLTCNLFGTPGDREAVGRFLDGMAKELEGEKRI